MDLVLGGHSHIYERSFLLDQAYGYRRCPQLRHTELFHPPWSREHILDPGDGDPSGDGAYQKNSGGNSHDGAVYIVAGHGGRAVGSTFGGAHPVMFSVDVQFGSVLLDVNGTTLTVSNLRENETISDTFSIQKIPSGTNVPPSGVIDTPVGNQTIEVGDFVSFLGTGTDSDSNLPLTHLWDFGVGSGIANSTQEDPGTTQFNTAGVFRVTYTVRDSLGLTDPTPATIQITVQGSGGGGFTAYNDLAWGTGQLSSNITTITSPNGGSGLPSSGQLLDFGTGLPTPVSLTVTGGALSAMPKLRRGPTRPPAMPLRSLMAS